MVDRQLSKGMLNNTNIYTRADSQKMDQFLSQAGGKPDQSQLTWEQ